MATKFKYSVAKGAMRKLVMKRVLIKNWMRLLIMSGMRFLPLAGP